MQVLVLCLDIIENNPLIVSKYIIADEDELIKLMTRIGTKKMSTG